MTTGEVSGDTAAVLTTALADVREMLERDGFVADWHLDGSGGVRFRVLAGSAACHDCLVPKPVMEAILGDALDGTPYTITGVELPGDGA